MDYVRDNKWWIKRWGLKNNTKRIATRVVTNIKSLRQPTAAERKRAAKYGGWFGLRRRNDKES